jgi:hypothetical protein
MKFDPCMNDEQHKKLWQMREDLIERLFKLVDTQADVIVRLDDRIVKLEKRIEEQSNGQR